MSHRSRFSMSRSVLSCLVLVAAMVTAIGGTAGGSPVTYPKDCQEVLAIAGAASPDGEYLIEPVAGRLFPVYCYDMAGGAPREYLTLENTGGDFNFSQYTAGGASLGSNVRTSFTRVRLDPATLQVNIFDRTFAASTGELCHSAFSYPCGNPVTWYPYASAADCFWLGSDTGLGNINLVGTPFKVADIFDAQGFYPAGSSVFSANDQIVDLRGGGYCGGTAPAEAYHLYMAYGGNEFLKLAYCGIPEAVVRFDAASRDIKVFDSVSGAEAGYVVLPSSAGEDDGAQELRQYTLAQCPANALVLTVKHMREGNAAKVSVVSMQYGRSAAVTAPNNKIQAEYADPFGTIRELEQKVQVTKQFDVKAKYREDRAVTVIQTAEAGDVKKRETKAGMVILELVTGNGSLTYRY